MKTVLGEGWENHIEGQKLKQDGDTFGLKLETQELYIYKDWKEKMEAQLPVVHGNIFKMVTSRTCSGIISKPQVNFAPEAITLAREVWICVYTRSCKCGHFSGSSSGKVVDLHDCIVTSLAMHQPWIHNIL